PSAYERKCDHTVERERDILRRLAAARPAHLDGDAPVDPAVRTCELTAAMNSAPAAHERARTGPVRPRTPQWLRPRWGVGLVSAAAATAVAVTLVPSGDGAGTPGDTPTAREFLLAAAAKVEKEGERKKDGAYWYQKERMGSIDRVPGRNGRPGYAIDSRSDHLSWLARDSHKRWSQTTDTGTRPSTKKDESAWRAAGAPRSWPKLGREWDGKGLVHRDAPGGPGHVVPMGNMKIEEMRKLPTGAKALRARLRQLVEKEYNAPDWVLRDEVVRKAVELAVGMPAGPELRAAAYRVLAEEPGVRALGTIRDQSGREGYGVAIPSPGPLSGDELRLVLDRRTGAALGTLRVATDNEYGRRKGEVTTYTTVLDTAWTNISPPFDRDYIRHQDGRTGPETPPAPAAPEPGNDAKAAEPAG
ncbi:CU044_5270 family protein, partial [Streptomyces clavuligerus]